MRLLAVLILVGLAVLILGSVCVSVDETEFVIITRFGNPDRVITDSGLQLKWPVPIQSTIRFDKRLHVYVHPNPDRREKEYLTRDKKNVEVATYTCWRIKDDRNSILRFLETVGDRAGAETRIGDIVAAELGSALGSYDFTALISADPQERRWDEITASIRDNCRRRVSESFGIEIADFRIERLNFPEQNRRSVFDRMRAERERIAARYRSEGDEEAMKIRADAERQREEILSEAFKIAEQTKGHADAEASRIYAQAYSLDPDFYEFLRTLESYEIALADGTVAILSADSQFLRLLNEPPMGKTETSANAE
jgi:membrane protease subunit HflC